MHYRLNRLFHPESKRTLIVAIDHALFNNAAFLDGIENMDKVVRTLAEANPDAMLLSPGEAPHLQKLPGRLKPALMLRADTANFYNDVLPSSRLFCQAYEDAVELAVRLDAACILLNLLQVDEFPEMLEQCVHNILRLKNICERYGMPMGIPCFRSSQSSYTEPLSGSPAKSSFRIRITATFLYQRNWCL